MFALMLNPRYKNFRIIFIFFSKELGVVVIEEYDKKAFFPIF